MKTLYTGVVTCQDGRAGHVTSSDGLLDLPLARPAEMGGEGGATNPEQLFAAAYAACFIGALKLVAKQQEIELQSIALTAEASLLLGDDNRYQIGIRLTGDLPAISEDRAMALMEEAHKICPYSNATRGNVEVKLGLKKTASSAGS